MSTLKDTPVEVKVFATEAGKAPFLEWLASLKDRRARAIVQTRLARIAAGNLGDAKTLRDGVSELRIDYAQGYRVYFSNQGPLVVLLLVGGEKRGQEKDIERAIEYLINWKQRQPK